ncbi:MAG: hypothetical protein A2539_06355 [Elusimicrobia bacterium RIFOXYD2_FULL_34_15]|nr:MAG: hypothetical protein A2539_06355 [Elusimicrobia bacterium RIFOXYD2_FULL_34_15]
MKRNKTIKIILFLLSISIAGSNIPTIYAKGAGSTVAEFLEISPSARASALGNAYTSLTNNGNSLYWNQAGLAKIRSSQVNLTHIAYFQNINYDYLSYSMPFRNIGVLSIGGLGIYSGGIDKTTEDSNGNFVDIDGNYNTLQTAIMLGLGRKINKQLYAGAGIKLIQEKIDTETTSGFALDLGGQCQIIKKLGAGLAVQNLGPKINGGTLPTSIKAGLDYKIVNNLTAALECDYLFERNFLFGAGAEYIYKDIVPVRVGYNNSPDTGGLSKLSAGTGVKLKNLEVNYAFVPYGDIGDAHKIDLTYRFDWKKSREKNFDAKINVIKEVPTSIYNIITERNIPVISIKITNTSDEEKKLKIVYNLRIKDIKDEKDIVLQGKETKETFLVPTLTQEDINKVISMPTLSIIDLEINQFADDSSIQATQKEQIPVMLFPCDQFVSQITDANGVTYDMLDTLVSWVTFNDRSLSEVISKAGEKGANLVPPVKIIGFQPPNIFAKMPTDTRSLDERDKDYLSQIKLIYDTLKEDYKLTYINQPIAYRNSQRIKFPYDTLKNKGNCIELAVLFASLLESIEIEPVIAIFPQDEHVSVGWKVQGEGKEICNMLETNMFGEDFDKVVAKGKVLVENNQLQTEFANGVAFDENGIFKKEPNVIIFDVKKMRAKIPPSPYVNR